MCLLLCTGREATLGDVAWNNITENRFKKYAEQHVLEIIGAFRIKNGVSEVVPKNLQQLSTPKAVPLPPPGPPNMRHHRLDGHHMPDPYQHPLNHDLTDNSNLFEGVHNARDGYKLALELEAEERRMQHVPTDHTNKHRKRHPEVKNVAVTEQLRRQSLTLEPSLETSNAEVQMPPHAPIPIVDLAEFDDHIESLCNPTAIPNRHSKPHRAELLGFGSLLPPARPHELDELRDQLIPPSAHDGDPYIVDERQMTNKMHKLNAQHAPCGPRSAIINNHRTQAHAHHTTLHVPPPAPDKHLRKPHSDHTHIEAAHYQLTEPLSESIFTQSTHATHSNGQHQSAGQSASQSAGGDPRYGHDSHAHLTAAHTGKFLKLRYNG